MSDRASWNDDGWKPSGGTPRSYVEKTPWDAWSTRHLEQDHRYPPPRLESTSGHRRRGGGAPISDAPLGLLGTAVPSVGAARTRRTGM